MTQTTDTANCPEEQIETIVVDPDDIIEAIRFNAQPPEYTNRRSAVIRISPPFDAEVNASVFHSEEGNHYPQEMVPKPIHLYPERFVSDEAMAVPDIGTERAYARDDLENPTDDEIDEYVQTAFEVWESNARQRLVDELLESRHGNYAAGSGNGLAGISIEYQEADE